MESTAETAELEAALERLEQSQTFARALGLLRLLRFMVEHSDASGEGAKEAYIGAVFYGRSGTYDPRYDSVVRVGVKRLRTRLLMYYASEGKDDVYRIVIPLGMYGVVLETVELAPAELLEPQAAGGSAIGVGDLGSASRAWWNWKMVAGVVVCVLVAGTLVWKLTRPPAESALLTHPLSALPLTPGRDLELDATQSPDGTMLAYVARPRDSVHFRIFLRPFRAVGQVGRDLDTGPGDALRPAWSPDGRTLAFNHCGIGPCDVSIVSVSGGPARRLQVLVRSFQKDDQAYFGNRGRLPIWSRDGKSLIFTDANSENGQESLVRYDLATGKEQMLTSGGNGADDLVPALSPDGNTVAFMREFVQSWDVMTLDLRTGQVRLVAALGQVHTDGLSWSPDGKGLLLSIIRKERWSPWWVPLQGEPRPLTVNLSFVLNPTFIDGGKSIMATWVNQAQNLVMAPEGEPGGASRKPEVLFRTTQLDSLGKFSPDGSRIAFLSNRSGRREIWTAELAPAGSAKLTSPPAQLTHNLVASGTLNITWSPDSRSLLVGLHGSPGVIAVVNAHDGTWSLLHVQGMESSTLYCPVWSADQRWIYASANGVKNGVFRIAPDGRVPPKELVEGFTYDIQVDGDRTLYYDSLTSDGVSRLRLDATGDSNGAKPEPLPALATVSLSRKWGIWDGGLYFLDLHDDERKLRRLDLQTQAVTAETGSLRNVTMAYPTMSVLPRRHLFLFSQGDENTGSQVVELRPE